MVDPTGPGWYTDPQQNGMDRYWYGEQWSNQTRPTNPWDQGPNSGGRPGAVEAPPREQHRGRNAGIVVAALVVIAVVVAVVIGSGSSNNHTAATPAGTVSLGTSTTGTPVVAKSPSTAATAATTRPPATTTTTRPLARTVAPSQSPFLAGTAHPNYPVASPGQISVVSVGVPDSTPGGSTVPIVLRNGTSQPVTDIQVTGAASAASGSLVGSGTSQSIYPEVVEPGQWALGYVYYEPGPTITSSDTFQFQTTSDAVRSFPLEKEDLQVTKVDLSGAAVVGEATNGTGETLQGPYSVGVFCLAADGAPTAQFEDFATPDGNAAPGATLSFQVALFGSPSCENYLVGVGGYRQ